MSTPSASCSCCGEPLADEQRIDVRFGLPDAALTAPEEARHTLGPSALLRVEGIGSFIRCLLPLALTGGIELVLGVWVETDEDTLRRAAAVWEDPAYAELVVRGGLANAVRPWGESILGAPVTARVAHDDELPYVVEGHDGTARRLLTETWDRDHVLSRFPHQLPVAVRTPLDDEWSVERSAGLAGRVADGVHQFAGPDRSVAATVFRDDSPGRAPEDFLAALLQGGPEAPPAQRLTEHLPDGLRHAFWLTPDDHDRPRHELYGYTVARDGSAAAVFCTHESADALAWAHHVWRSLDRGR
ncbi:DUF2199 domain-containing protein [Streptomyces echinoruber]|uniref:DUF2199 domain-containing protein n=1 Tax=Streptomyces echinoruber TaxID=68898 RepID=A0A918RI71_9ACTN|nr:DUF2199 domain-containing protein [Streptomyces echinoruber]GGZ97484.1 hypothetical protein GCM10010389_40850 [Streptomyces echinoruber]